MPRLTWDPKKGPEVNAARLVYDLYVNRQYRARHDGVIIRTFDAKVAVLDFEPLPNLFDRLMREEE